jgi:hypothetical protein
MEAVPTGTTKQKFFLQLTSGKLIWIFFELNQGILEYSKETINYRILK